MAEAGRADRALRRRASLGDHIGNAEPLVRSGPGSHAPQRAVGATRLGHRATERALAAADLVITVNPRDVAGVRTRLRSGARQVWLPPSSMSGPISRRGRIERRTTYRCCWPSA